MEGITEANMQDRELTMSTVPPPQRQPLPPVATIPAEDPKKPRLVASYLAAHAQALLDQVRAAQFRGKLFVKDTVDGTACLLSTTVDRAVELLSILHSIRSRSNKEQLSFFYEPWEDLIPASQRRLVASWLQEPTVSVLDTIALLWTQCRFAVEIVPSALEGNENLVYLFADNDHSDDLVTILTRYSAHVQLIYYANHWPAPFPVQPSYGKAGLAFPHRGKEGVRMEQSFLNPTSTFSSSSSSSSNNIKKRKQSETTTSLQQTANVTNSQVVVARCNQENSEYFGSIRAAIRERVTNMDKWIFTSFNNQDMLLATFPHRARQLIDVLKAYEPDYFTFYDECCVALVEYVGSMEGLREMLEWDLKQGVKCTIRPMSDQDNNLYHLYTRYGKDADSLANVLTLKRQHHWPVTLKALYWNSGNATPAATATEQQQPGDAYCRVLSLEYQLGYALLVELLQRHISFPFEVLPNPASERMYFLYTRAKHARTLAQLLCQGDVWMPTVHIVYYRNSTISTQHVVATQGEVGWFDAGAAAPMSNVHSTVRTEESLVEWTPDEVREFNKRFEESVNEADKQSIMARSASSGGGGSWPVAGGDGHRGLGMWGEPPQYGGRPSREGVPALQQDLDAVERAIMEETLRDDLAALNIPPFKSNGPVSGVICGWCLKAAPIWMTSECKHVTFCDDCHRKYLDSHLKGICPSVDCLQPVTSYATYVPTPATERNMVCLRRLSVLGIPAFESTRPAILCGWCLKDPAVWMTDKCKHVTFCDACHVRYTRTIMSGICPARDCLRVVGQYQKYEPGNSRGTWSPAQRERLIKLLLDNNLKPPRFQITGLECAWCFNCDATSVAKPCEHIAFCPTCLAKYRKLPDLCSICPYQDCLTPNTTFEPWDVEIHPQPAYGTQVEDVSVASPAPSIKRNYTTEKDDDAYYMIEEDDDDDNNDADEESILDYDTYAMDVEVSDNDDGDDGERT